MNQGRIKQGIAFTGLMGILLWIGLSTCQRTTTTPLQFNRAHDPWVFRSVLDEKARMLTVALHPNLWLAYDASTGGLAEAWAGDVELDGAVYTTAHGPQPESRGDIWLSNQHEQVWHVERNGKSEKVQINYRGHRFEEDEVYIQTEITLANGELVTISERPEYISNESKQTGLERLFIVQGLPKDVQLVHHTGVQSIPSERSIKTDAQWRVRSSSARTRGNVMGVDVDGELVLPKDGTYYLRTYFTKYPLIKNPNRSTEDALAMDSRPEGDRLIERSGCKTCHNTYVKTIGPAYLEVAKRYRHTRDNVTMLVGKIKNGGSGVWGEAAMIPHDDLPENEIEQMVTYIMDLDAEEEAKQVAVAGADSGFDPEQALASEADYPEAEYLPGARIRVFVEKEGPLKLDDLNWAKKPDYEGLIYEIDAEGGDFSGLSDNFGIDIMGYLKIPKTNNYVFRISSDDGSRLFLNGSLLADNDGRHGTVAVDAEIALQEGYHPIRIQYFQGGGGKVLSFQYRAYGAKEWSVVPTDMLLHHKSQEPNYIGEGIMEAQSLLPGDGSMVPGVHPSYTLTQARPNGFAPKVGGMDFLSDGRLVICTWDAEGAVYILDGVAGGDPANITYKKVARGLAEPLGLKVVNDTIYVLQKQELTQLIDHDGDEQIDEYRTVSNDWEVSANFHEFAFGLAYREPYFYGTLAIAILPGGASANPQIKDRGKAFRIDKRTGHLDFIASGLRTPNGIGFGVDGELFIADNQGDWLPSCKILHVSEGAFFGSRAVDSARVANLPVKQPMVWLPQDEIGNSPTTPSLFPDGPFAGQMLHGEVTHGGLKRVFVEKVAGEYQGAVFRFTQGIEAGVNRHVWGPDNALYVGGVGSTGNWSQTGKLYYGLQRLALNGQSSFEMLAVRAKSNGMEIELTEPLPPNEGWSPAAYQVKQWWYKPTHDYGGPKLDEETIAVQSVSISDDRKKIFLELSGLKPQHVVYIHLPSDWVSTENHSLWSTEAWYTLNNIPADQPGFRIVAPAPVSPNTLTSAERSDGWQLLFDGQTTQGWHNFGKTTIGTSWKVADGALYLDARPDPDGNWQAPDGGDIVSEQAYKDFELRMEWRISPCGNSGIMYNVVESDKYQYPWQTGPEMQILDNTCHPDARIVTHRAGDLYDMISAVPETVRPAGSWNKIRLRIKDGQVEHWLNGRKVVTYAINDDEWLSRIANSKFKDMSDFGRADKGKISLQDHGNPVWFRNIKIRPL